MTECERYDNCSHDDIAHKPRHKDTPDLAGGDDISQCEGVGTPGCTHNIVDQYTKEQQQRPVPPVLKIEIHFKGSQGNQRDENLQEAGDRPVDRNIRQE